MTLSSALLTVGTLGCAAVGVFSQTNMNYTRPAQFNHKLGLGAFKTVFKGYDSEEGSEVTESYERVALKNSHVNTAAGGMESGQHGSVRRGGETSGSHPPLSTACPPALAALSRRPTRLLHPAASQSNPVAQRTHSTLQPVRTI